MSPLLVSTILYILYFVQLQLETMFFKEYLKGRQQKIIQAIERVLLKDDTNHDRLNSLINNQGICRTAPATLDLLFISHIDGELHLKWKWKLNI